MSYNLNALYLAFAETVENEKFIYHHARTNTKLGEAPSFNTLPIVTCASCCMGTCGENGCYACKNALCHGYDMKTNNCLRAWAENTAMMVYKTEEYFTNVIADITKYKAKCDKKGIECYIRIHSAGDFYSYNVFAKWLHVARIFPSVHFLAFTKQFQFVEKAKRIPRNLSIVPSDWEGIEMPDSIKKRFRIAYVGCGENCINCPGSCKTCKCCWHLKELKKNVRFKKH